MVLEEHHATQKAQHPKGPKKQQASNRPEEKTSISEKYIKIIEAESVNTPSTNESRMGSDAMQSPPKMRIPIRSISETCTKTSKSTPT